MTIKHILELEVCVIRKFLMLKYVIKIPKTPLNAGCTNIVRASKIHQSYQNLLLYSIFMKHEKFANFIGLKPQSTMPICNTSIQPRY